MIDSICHWCCWWNILEIRAIWLTTWKFSFDFFLRRVSVRVIFLPFLFFIFRFSFFGCCWRIHTFYYYYTSFMYKCLHTPWCWHLTFLISKYVYIKINANNKHKNVGTIYAEKCTSKKKKKRKKHQQQIKAQCQRNAKKISQNE